MKPFLLLTISGVSPHLSGMNESASSKQSSPVPEGLAYMHRVVFGHNVRLKIVYLGAIMVVSPGINRPQMIAPSFGVLRWPPVGSAGCNRRASFTTPFKYGSFCITLSSEQSTTASSACSFSVLAGSLARR